MKNAGTKNFLFLISVLFVLLTINSCKEEPSIHYIVSVSEIDSLLSANGEVHILLPEGTMIELPESGNTIEKKRTGENMSPGLDQQKNVFGTIRQTLGTSIMNANAATAGPWKCPPYCEVVLKKAQ